MKIIHHFITVSLLISSLVILTLSQFSSADDTDVMFKLAKSITPAPPGWSGRDPCKWIGVSCSAGSVININLKSKFFSGKIPPEISQLSNLRIISFQQNNFDGPLPPLSNMGSLQKVYLNENGFTSIPPGFLSDLPSLQTISISNNPLKPWTIPDILTNLTSLQTFEAANTSLYGEIPDFFNSLPSLQELRLSYNNLTGPLPTSFGGSSIQKLWVNNMEKDHGLSGSIEVLAKMPSLTQAWLHGNAFEGPIPSDLSNCTQLFDLNLGSNMLTGPVPESLTKLQSLQNVSLQGNFLQGAMPVFGKGVDATFGSNVFCNPKPGPCDPQVTTLIEIAGAMGYPKSLAQTWTGNDACNGPWAHITCDTRKTVTGINLAKQGLSGTISPAFSNLSSLTTVILNGNGLYGKVPKELTNLKLLRRLDVSNNNLTGEVPKFASGVRLDVSGNKFLGSNVDTTPKSPPSDVISFGDEGRSSESSTEGGGGSSKSSRSYTWIVIVVVVAVVIVVLLILFVLYKKRKLRFSHGYDEESSGTMMKKRTTTTTMMKPISRSPSSFKKSSPQIHALDGGNVVYPMGLLQEATNNFSEKNVLGRGGFGVVYLGVLADGTHIAVKRMESSSIGNKGMNEFEAEIGVLSRVRHRHLVALLGYCVNGNDKIVVYEYMPQGTMAQHLFEWRVKGLPCLTWKQRLVIALDVARGVEYLHSLAQQSFIHRDLKPSNVLLGNDMRAKVSDFGLVKLAPDGKYSLETRLAGTFGYLAPEYASTGRVTTKIDVFAYGVILMEMITGRKALDDSLPEEMVQLSYWFRRVLITKDLDQISKHIDPALNPVDQEKLNSIQKVAELAGHCTAREPKERPDMSHAVSVLLPLVEDWRPKPTAPNYEDSVNMSMESIPLAMKKWQSGDTTFEDYPISSSTTDQSSFPTDATPSTKSTTRDHGPS